MGVLAIAIWLVSEDQKVPLQQGDERYGDNFYRPVEGWIRWGESPVGAAARRIEEEFGPDFASKYPFLDLVRITDRSFFLKNELPALRRHFLGRVTNQQLGLISSSAKLKIRFVGKEDLPKFKKLGETSKDSDIILFEDNCDILRWLFEEKR